MSTTDARSGDGRGRVSPFGALVAATAISSIGDGVLLVAGPLLATSLTTRPSLVAGAAVMARLPWLLAPVTGALADRLPRAVVFAVVEAVRAVVLGAFGLLVWAGDADLWHLYLTVFVLATAETVFAAAALGAPPALVDDDALPRANGRLYTVQVAGEQFIGPALGGLVFALGAAAAFIVDGLSFAFSGLLLLAAFPLRRATTPQPARQAPVAEGFRHLRGSPLLRSLAWTIAAYSFCQAAVLSTIVLFATEALDLSTQQFGIFMSCGAVGNVVGGVIVHRVTRRLGAGTILVVCGLGAASGYLLAASTTSAIVAALAFVAEAICVSIAMVTTLTLRQRAIPPELHGRVGSLVRSAAYVAMALGALAGGVIVESYDVRMPLIAAGVLQIAAVALIVAPRRRHFEAIPTDSPGAAPTGVSGDTVVLDETGTGGGAGGGGAGGNRLLGV